MPAYGKALPRSKGFTHAHAPRQHPRHDVQGAARPRSPEAAGQRHRFVEECRQHGNYPWVGSARQALGRTTDVDASGLHCVAGIGPSYACVHGMGGCERPLSRKDRFGNLHLDANDGPAPKRVYEVRQAIRPRSAARSPRPLKKGHYTDYMLHNLADTYFLALRNRDFVEYPAPGQYDVTEASAHGSIPLRFGPPRLDDGKRCRMGRSCDLNASAPRQQDRLRATREHGPLFCKETARRARRSRSAMGSRASWNANSPLNSFMVDRTEDERPTLRTFLKKFQQAEDNGRGGSSFRLHHTVPVRRKVTRDLWRQTSFADFTHSRHCIVWDKDKRQNVTKYVAANTSEHSLRGLSESRGSSRSTAGSVLSTSATEVSESLQQGTKGGRRREGRDDTEYVLRTMQTDMGGLVQAQHGGHRLFHVFGGAGHSKLDDFGYHMVEFDDDEEQDSLEMEVKRIMQQAGDYQNFGDPSESVLPRGPSLGGQASAGRRGR